MIPLYTIWGALLAVFLLAEAATVGLAAIWFACGALVALILALLHLPLWVQIAAFIVVSSVSLAATRPLAQKYLNAKRKPTNADRVLNMVGIVTEDIDNVLNTGAVSVGGKVWTARSESGAPIQNGALVKPVAIDGVKLIVQLVREMDPATK